MANKPVKCLICNKKFPTTSSLYSHMENKHKEELPNNFSPSQYHFYLKTGKEHGSCVVCGDNTDWNESTNKYHRFCNNKICKEKYIAEFKKRMVSKYGKVSLLDDPEHQRKMLANRKISGTYVWTDGSKKTYTGNYELDFLKFLDAFMDFDSNDVITPSPHTYNYIYEGERKFYIPDIYIPSLNLEIEIKASDNMHHKIQAVDKVKEKLKDDVMYSIKNINYVKVMDKKYDSFIQYLIDLKNRDNTGKGYTYKSNNNIKESWDMEEVSLNEVLDLSESFQENFLHDFNRLIGEEITPLNENVVYDPDFHKKTEPLYIVLLSNNTLRGGIIKKVTDSLYTHATLSLDASLNKLYEFNTGVDNGGFYVESIYSPKFRDCQYFTISVVFITKEMKEKIKKKLEIFLKDKTKYKYNVEGCIKYFFKFKDLGSQNPTEKIKFFCSEFIAYLLKDLSPDFNNILISPGDFISATGFRQLKTYTIPHYDEKEVIKLTKYAREDLLMLNRGVNNINESFFLNKRKEKTEYMKTIERYKTDINWKKIFDIYRKLFYMNKDDMQIYYKIIDIILYEHVKKISPKDVEKTIISEMNSIYKFISNDINGIRKLFFITNIDVKKSLIYVTFDESNGTSLKFPYPLNNIMEEGNISGLMVPSYIHLNEKVSPEELCSALATYYTGIWDRKQKFINVSPTPEEFVDRYKSMSVEEFEEYKVGLSWDFSNFIKTYFSKHYPEIVINQYLLETDNFGSSFHSFTVFEDGKVYKLIEPIYKNNIGIHSFNNMESLFEYVIKMVTSVEVPVKIYKYEKMPIGANIIDIIENIESEGELVFEK